MSWIDTLRNWLGGTEQNQASDPRLYDGVSNSLQFGEAEANRLERANPEVPEETGKITTIQTGEWEPIKHEGAYWDNVRHEVGKDGADAFYARMVAEADIGDTQETHWIGPFGSEQEAADFGRTEVDATQAAWSLHIQSEAEIADVADHNAGIDSISRGQWQGVDGIWETRISIGKSDEGWHYEVEKSQYGDETISTGWSEAYVSEDAARDASLGAYDRFMANEEQQALDREDREIAQVERTETKREAASLER